MHGLWTECPQVQWHGPIVVSAIVLGKKIRPQLFKGRHCLLREGKGLAVLQSRAPSQTDTVYGASPSGSVSPSPSGCVISGGTKEGIDDLSSALRMPFRQLSSLPYCHRQRWCHNDGALSRATQFSQFLVNQIGDQNFHQTPEVRGVNLVEHLHCCLVCP